MKIRINGREVDVDTIDDSDLDELREQGVNVSLYGTQVNHQSFD